MKSCLSFWSGWKQCLPSSGWPLRGGKAIIASVLSECVITPYIYMKRKRRGGRSGRKAAGGKGCSGWAFVVLVGACSAALQCIFLWLVSSLRPLTLTVNRPSQDDFSPRVNWKMMMCGRQTPHKLMFSLSVPCSPNWISHPWETCSLIRRLRRQPISHVLNDSQSFWHFRYIWILFTWAFQLLNRSFRNEWMDGLQHRT